MRNKFYKYFLFLGELVMKAVTAILFLCCIGLSAQCYALGYSSDYEPCMRKAGSQTNALRACQVDELKVQNKRSKKIFKKTLRNTDVEDKALIQQMQEKWLQQREGACGLMNKKPKNYSAANASCAIQMTVSHADMLEVRLGNNITK